MKECYHKYKLSSVLILVFSLLLFSVSLAQNNEYLQTKNKEIGSPPLKNFEAIEYNAGPEIRSIMMSKRGLIYAASNSNDILEYDGVAWKKIHVPCTYVYSMVEDKNGNIHIANGLIRCIGYLKPNSTTGEWDFEPLRPENVSDSSWNQVTVSLANKIGEEVYYMFGVENPELGGHITFKFEDGTLKEAFRINRDDIKGAYMTQKGVFYHNDKQLFFKKITENKEDTSYDSLENTSSLNGQNIYKILDYSEDEILIFGVNTGVKIYNLKTKQLKIFGSEQLQNILKTSQILNAKQTKNGDWLFGSIQRGIIQTNAKGELIRTISIKEGLIGNIVMSFAEDNQNQVWTALYNGISRVNTSTPLEHWNEQKGVLGNGVYDIIRYQNTIFAGTVTDVVVLQDDGNWKAIEGTPIENRILRKLILADGKEHLFMGGVDGLYEIQKDKQGVWQLIPILKDQQPFRVSVIHNNKENPNRIYIDLLQDGAGGYIDYGKKNEKLNPITFLEDRRISAVFSENETLWGFERVDTTAYVVKINPQKETVISYPVTSNWFARIDGEMNIFSLYSDSIFIVKEDNSLQLNTQLMDLFGEYSTRTHQIQQRGNGTLWVYTPQDFFLHIYSKTDKGYKRNIELEQALGKYNIRNLYEDEANPNVVWVGTSTGVLRVDVENSTIETEVKAFKSIIRQVKIGNDSLVFAGNFFTSTKAKNDSTVYKIEEHQTDKDFIILDYNQNSIAFTVSSLFFIEEQRTQYSYFLEGLDEKWSDWTNLNVKEYNNLKEGEYIFKVKAKNYLGQESAEATYKFSVLPPWHRTTTAYILYVIFGVGIIFGSSRIYTHRLRQQNEQLENLVAERTDELSQKNAELSTQNEEIVQQRDQLDTKNQQIEEQNKNIVSSINYAKRIQTALLPMEERIKQEIPNHFIFYKPRDIVSGDFYWIEKVEDKIIIAVADCTGHGVPGAFMSMLGSSGLTDAVFQQKLTSPDLILTHLHNYIYAALKQSQSDNKDGMDICIIVWDKTKNQIQYAGAMNPLYYIQNEEFYTIKADKIPVGGTVSKERIYTPHTINLTTETTIYLASDGYQDQFGGENERKFMTKRFRELLLEISHLPMQEQEKRISDVFERWKGNSKQIDDVLVMGMKLG